MEERRERRQKEEEEEKEKVSNHRRLVVDGNSLLHHRSPVNSLEEWMALDFSRIFRTASKTLLGVALKQLLQD